MAAPYVAPTLNEDGFNCPFCEAFAEQPQADLTWNNIVTDYRGTRCARCRDIGLWEDARLIYPPARTAPAAHEELPDFIRSDFEEAASILERSPRGAAGLLRLVIQELVDSLVDGTANLNDKIGALVARGLDPVVQQSLDIVRVVGNNALHPGEMDLRDDRATAVTMFGLVNEIVEATIARPRRVAALFGSLPDGAREAIGRRDRGQETARS